MANEYNYRLSTGVRARQEKFGLLFYNSKDTNLTFVKSGSLLTIKSKDLFESLDANEYIIKQHCKNSTENEKINRVLKMLVKKGLVVEIRSGI